MECETRTINSFVEEYKKALALAEKYHEGQKDIGGVDYIQHVKEVARNIDTENMLDFYLASITALLHDIIEDCGVTEYDLLSAGISMEVIENVLILTHKKDESYQDYIIRINEHPIATLVKIEDLRHNMDITRLKKLDNNAFKRLKKYLYSFKYLKGEISKKEYIKEMDKIFSTVKN